LNSWPYRFRLKRNESSALSSFKLEEFLPYQLAVLANRISEQFSDKYRERFGISVSEWRVIAHLAQSEKVSIREVFKQVQMDKSKASRAAARLEKAGYVSKKINPADRRLVELSLTAKGRAMADEIGPMGLAFQTEIMNSLPEQDRGAFLAAIETLMEHHK
jgi:DNA-binding MarR family transcriptional regulator